MNEKEILKKLISINSVSGNEEQIINFIPNLITNKKAFINKYKNNLLINIKGLDDQKALIFNGHVDTVSPGLLADWKTNPFDAAEIDGKIYGLGAIDMKGSISSMINLINEIENPKYDLWFMFVSMEETDGSGTKNSIEWMKNKGILKKYTKVSAIIGEPTGLDYVEIGHKGNAFVQIISNGDTGHGSRPQNIKINSIEKSYEIIKSIDNFDKELKEKYINEHLGSPSIGLTGIQSESFESPNKFPSKCTIQLDIRTNPEFHNKLSEEIDNWLEKYKVEWKYVSEPANYGWCSPEEKIVEVIKNNNRKCKITVSQGSTDQCFFTQEDIPTIVIGPRDGKMCHKTNECIETDQLFKTTELYKKIINDY